LVGEVSPEVVRAMQKVPGFVTLFQIVEIAPLEPEKVDGALAAVAERRGARLDEASRRALVKLTGRFLAARPQPGPALALLDPVRTHPFHVVLFDELEKAHPNVWDLLLPLLDEGRLTAPGGDMVSFLNTILIATSNVGAQQAERALGFGAESDGSARQGRTR